MVDSCSISASTIQTRKLYNILLMHNKVSHETQPNENKKKNFFNLIFDYIFLFRNSIFCCCCLFSVVSSWIKIVCISCQVISLVFYRLLFICMCEMLFGPFRIKNKNGIKTRNIDKRSERVYSVLHRIYNEIHLCIWTSEGFQKFSFLFFSYVLCVSFHILLFFSLSCVQEYSISISNSLFRILLLLPFCFDCISYIYVAALMFSTCF